MLPFKNNKNNLFFILSLALPQILFAADTELKLYRPFAETTLTIVKTLNGDCLQQSKHIKREDAWHCFAGGKVYDPCFVKPFGAQRRAICPSSPWDTSAVEIQMATDANNYGFITLDMSRTLPWAVELSHGEKCEAIDEGQTFDNLPVRYRCNNQTQLIGEVHRCKSDWSVLQQTQNSVLTVFITKAWF